MSGGVCVFGVHAGKMDDSEKLKIISGSWRNFECDKFSISGGQGRENLIYQKIFRPWVSVPVKELFMHSAFTNTAKSFAEKRRKGETPAYTRLGWSADLKTMRTGRSSGRQTPFRQFSRVIYLWQAGKPLSSQHIHRSRAAFRRKFSSSMRSHIHMNDSRALLSLFSPDTISKSNVAEEIKKFK